MLTMLKSIVGLIVSLVEFIVNSFVSLITFITNIPTYFNFISVLLSVLPSIILPFAVAGVSLTIVAMLIRRNIL